MARINNTWFEFAGKISSDMGVQLKDAHIDFSGKWRGRLEEVFGRSGYLWTDGHARDYIEIKRTCRVRQSNKRAVKAWLMGGGLLRFSGEPDAQYDARIIDQIEFRMVCSGADPIYEFQVTFTCQPDPYIYPPENTITISASGTELKTPDNAYALPKIEIHGSGSFSLTIGMETLFFEGIEGGIVVDSELVDALDLDGNQLLNNRISGTPFKIQPGLNIVSWILEDGAAIESIIITPRWRYI